MFTVFKKGFIKLTTKLKLSPSLFRGKVKRLGKKTLTALITLVLVILPTALLILFNSAKTVEAAWPPALRAFSEPEVLQNRWLGPEGLMKTGDSYEKD